jgi:hypothetical protein
MESGMKKRTKLYLFNTILLIAIILSLIACDDTTPNKKYRLISKPSIALAVLYDASGNNCGLMELKSKDLFSEITEHMISGAGGNLRFNFVSSNSHFRGVELFIKPLDIIMPDPPSESASSGSLKFTDELGDYNDTKTELMRKVLPLYDSVNLHKIAGFTQDYNNYLNKAISANLRNSSQLEYSLDRMLPFFESSLKGSRKILVVFSDGVSNDFSGYTPDLEAFSRLGIETFVIGLNRKKARGKWLNIPFKQASYYETIIYNILSSNQGDLL